MAHVAAGHHVYASVTVMHGTRPDVLPASRRCPAVCNDGVLRFRCVTCATW